MLQDVPYPCHGVSLSLLVLMSSAVDDMGLVNPRGIKGFRLRRSKLYRYAKDAIEHGRQYAYRDRKNRKRTFRALWNLRINAAARDAGITYSRFIEGLKAANVDVNRKVLADLAATDSAAFGE